MDALTCPEVYDSYIKLPTADSPIPDEIEKSTKFFPFFKDAQGAIDGTHISVSPPANDRARYRNRKGAVSQNVLAACTFDLQFCYLLTGWEGSAADSAVFADAREHDLKLAPGKFFLADAGFPLCTELMVPYRAVRYHLREWEKANNK